MNCCWNTWNTSSSTMSHWGNGNGGGAYPISCALVWEIWQNRILVLLYEEFCVDRWQSYPQSQEFFTDNETWIRSPTLFPRNTRNTIHKAKGFYAFGRNGLLRPSLIHSLWHFSVPHLHWNCFRPRPKPRNYSGLDSNESFIIAQLNKQFSAK